MVNFFQTSNMLSFLKSIAKFEMSLIFKVLIRFYQATFSYFLGGNCRYYPSCSHYAYEAFALHKPHKAFYLTLKRLLSCHPFSKKAFYDPVPTDNLSNRRGENE